MLFHLANQFGHLQASLSLPFHVAASMHGMFNWTFRDRSIEGRNFRVNLGVDLRGQKWWKVVFVLPSLKLTAKAPENRGPLEVWRFLLGNHHF